MSEAVSKDPPKITRDTFLVSYNACPNDPYGASSMPIYQSATFKQPSATEFGPYDYTRSGNPTRDALQNQVAELEGLAGAKAFCFTTGMAAIAAVCRLVKSGEEIIVNDDSYGGTYRIMSSICVRQGITVKYLNLEGAEGMNVLKNALAVNTRLVIIESPTNPMQRICNIRELSRVCHENSVCELGTLLAVDNTMMSPMLSRPLEHDADIVIHSATKFLCGHSDTMAGVVTVRSEARPREKSMADQIYFYQNAEGTGLAPFDCWLVLRGIKTMAIRMERMQKNAVAIAKWLKASPVITTVYYAGLEDHPNHKLHMSQASGGGSIGKRKLSSIE